MDKNNDSKLYYNVPTFARCQHKPSSSFLVLLKLYFDEHSDSDCVSLSCELGQISLEEFIEGAEKDPWVMEQLKLDIGPCDWFVEHQEKKT